MIVIGLTGQSGAGKSSAAAVFSKNGFPVLDADSIYHSLLSAHSVLTKEIVAAFGEDMLLPDGCLDRKKLASLVFKNDNRVLLDRLNQITHRAVTEKLRMLMKEQEKNGARCILVDAPQLFEAGFDRECDYVIAVTAHADVLKTRIMKRDGISAEEAERRLAAQHTRDFFEQHCDFIIENNGDKEQLCRKTEAVLAAIKERETV